MEVYKKTGEVMKRMDTDYHPLMVKSDYIESLEYSLKNLNVPTSLVRIMFNLLEDWTQSGAKNSEL